MTVADYEVSGLWTAVTILSVDDPIMRDPDVLSPAPASSALIPADASRSSATGRELAARALLAGCPPQRAGDLLGVSRRTVADWRRST